MKKALFLSIPFLLASALTSCGNQPAPEEPKNLSIWHALTTENLLSDFDYISQDEYKERKGELNFSCMKNENEGAVLMLTPNYFVSSYNLEINDVSDDSGHKIGKENFSVAAMWYQGVFGTNETQAYSGYYPDALIPLENYRKASHDYIDPDRNQGIYVNLKSPEDAYPGVYKGTAKLTVDDETFDIPMNVTIYNADMPVEVHQQTCFLIWYDKIPSGEKANTSEELYKKYYDFVVDKRLSPSSLPPAYENGYSAFAENYYKEVVMNPKVSTYRLPVIYSNVSQGRVEGYLEALIDKNIELLKKGEKDYNGQPVDFFKKCLFYVNDEPASSEDFASVRANDLLITKAKQKFRSKLDAYPEAQKSFMSIKNVVTTGYSDILVGSDSKGGVQTWCPQFTWFGTEKARQNYASRQIVENTNREFGENVWWYGCYDPQSPYPSYHLDADIITSRVLSSMQYDYNIEGNLYWNVCYYAYHGNGIDSGRDIWYDPITWEDCAGDGALVYPGVNYNIKSPITTLRLESILAANEEYEYYWMIEQKVNEYNKTHDPIDFHDLMRKHYAKIFINMDTVATPESYEESRNFFLSVIEKLNSNLEEGIAMLKA